jgi:NarL family two-component system response regulator LiaR
MKMENKIRVLYVEDDEEWRAGLSHFFSEHERIDLYACVSSIIACFDVLREEPTDVVVLDIMLGDEKITGLDAALDITALYPSVKIIMLSSIDNDDEIFNEAFLNGAYDYLYKYDFEKLPDTIHEAMNNPASKYGDRLKKLVYEKKKSMISKGDSEILIRLRDGMTQIQIAEELHVSLAAVKKHIGRLMKKFNWERSSNALAVKCDKWGLLDSESEE